LLKVIPNLHQFITRHQKVNGEAVSEESPTPALPTSRLFSACIQLLLAWSSGKLKMDLRAIISVVTPAYSAVVLFFDDLQWADRASMDIIHFLQESQDLSAFLLVGAHRYDDTSEANTPIQHRQANLLVTAHASSISLHNFDLHWLNSILS
jgi:predicted ATPase